MADGESCELCGRHVSMFTRHHLIPRTRHANKRNKREYNTFESLATLPDVQRFVAWIRKKPSDFRPASHNSGRKA